MEQALMYDPMTAVRELREAGMGYSADDNGLCYARSEMASTLPELSTRIG
jgi:hypothetical protein